MSEQTRQGDLSNGRKRSPFPPGGSRGLFSSLGKNRNSPHGTRSFISWRDGKIRASLSLLLRWWKKRCKASPPPIREQRRATRRGDFLAPSFFFFSVLGAVRRRARVFPSVSHYRSEDALRVLFLLFSFTKGLATSEIRDGVPPQARFATERLEFWLESSLFFDVTAEIKTTSHPFPRLRMLRT